jgi:hypothetical protein
VEPVQVGESDASRSWNRGGAVPSLAASMIVTVLVSSLVSTVAVFVLRHRPVLAAIAGISLGIAASFAARYATQSWIEAEAGPGFGPIVYTLLGWPFLVLALVMAVAWPLCLTLVEVSWLVSRNAESAADSERPSNKRFQPTPSATLRPSRNHRG